LLRFFHILVLVVSLSAAAQADEAVDLELVLAVDVSGSMDPDEQELQRAGYVAALTHPDVIAGIRSGPYGRIAVTYVEWGSWQRIAVPWAIVDGQQTAAAFAAALAEAPLGTLSRTSISGGLLFAAELFDENRLEGMRRVIDISGDGPNNLGPPVATTRDAIVERGIVINGLPFMLKTGGRGYIDNLDFYYEDCVIGGPGAFLIAVRNRAQLADAIRQKLVLEVAGHAPKVIQASAEQREPRVDCLIGEQMRRQWMDQ
jgi:hypothetical protein